MKFVRVMLVSVFSLFLLTACAEWQMSQSTPSSSPVIDRIIDRGELVVGAMGNMPPMNMKTKDGNTIGMEVDLVKTIAAAMDVNYRFVNMPFSELIPALRAGKVDMIVSGMTITPNRNLKVAFVGPYFLSGKAFLTTIKNHCRSRRGRGCKQPRDKVGGAERIHQSGLC